MPESVDHSLRFRVRESFALTGRGTVAAGHVEQGEVQPGDRLLLYRGTRTSVVVSCAGVSPIRESGWAAGHAVLVGLLLPGLSPSEVAPGDEITTLPPLIDRVLSSSIVWTWNPDEPSTLHGEAEGLALKLRINDFTDEILFTLSADGSPLADFNNRPEGWSIPPPPRPD